MDVIREEVDTLIGLRIVEEHDTYCVLKSLTKGMHDEYPALFRKVFMQTERMFEELQERKHDKNRIKSLHKETMRFALFCRKIIVEQGDSFAKTNDYVLLQRLTMISNNLLYVMLRLVKEPLHGKDKAHLPFVADMYKLFHATYYKPSYDSLLVLNERRMKFFDEMENQKKRTIVTHYL
jgi:hypothetical protein